MITDIYFVYNDNSQVKQIEENVKSPVFFHFIDSRSLKGKKEAYKLKSHWAAREDPFALVMDGEEAIKAFYSEAEDVVKSLTNYLNNE